MATKATPQYSDFLTQFLIHPVSNDLARATEEEAVKRSLKNLILTSKYERLDPRIGSNINAALFEPMDGKTTLIIRDYIKETIENYEPRVSSKTIIVSPDYDGNAYNISIYFTIKASEQVVQLDIYLARIR